MSWSILAGLPRVLFDVNGDPYSGAVLKAYLPGTTTSTSLAIDSAGSSPQTTITFNAEGKLEVSGNEIQAYIDRKCKWGIFANATDATANTPFYMGPFDNVDLVASSTNTIKPFATLALAVADTVLVEGDALNIAERTTGNGGGAMWDVVLSSTVTENALDIVQGVGVGTLSLVQRELEKPYGVATIAALKAVDLIPGQVAQTIGYYDGWAAQLEPEGGGTYTIADQADVRTQRSDGAWVPDTFVHQLLDNGFVAMLDLTNVFIKQGGSLGDDSTDDFTAMQATVTEVCTDNRTLRFTEGSYKISAPVVFPNTSWRVEGDGPTGTVIKAHNPSASTNLFDLTNNNAPAKVIKYITFEGPAGGNSGAGSGIFCSSTNGLLVDSCWFIGILRGLEANGSFINCNQCVAEFCDVGAKVTSSMDESTWIGWTMFNNIVDFDITGTQETFKISDTNAIGTITDIFKLTCDGVIIDGVSVQDTAPASGRTPDILDINGQDNQISNISCTNFAGRGAFLSGAGATGNRFNNLHFDGVPIGIFCSSASGNVFTGLNLLNAATYGIQNDTCTNRFDDFVIDACDTGIWINANGESRFTNGEIKSSVTADWEEFATNTGRLIVDNVSADFTGLTGPFLRKYVSSGNYKVYVSTVPTSQAWTRGDQAINVAPAVGSPIGWRCTVSGTPGTWVAEANL